jgi:cathepsin K
MTPFERSPREGRAGRFMTVPRRFRSLGRSRFSIAWLLLGLLVVSSQTVWSETSTLAETRALIAENGWTFEVDDSFINSLTPEARANLHGFVPPDDYEKILASHLKVFAVPKDLPSNWNWLDMGGETPVQNQGECGSCWAFAAAGEMESRIKIEYGVQLNISEQQIISCNPYGAGCSGGWAGAAYQVCYSYGGINEHCMPYGGGMADYVPCTQTQHFPFAKITGWHSVSNDVEQIKTALLDGPVCTSVDGSGPFEDYSGGCYNAPGGGTNHLIVIMGWDDRLCGGNGAWIVKNSWGTAWGMSGYGYIQYGAGSVGIGVTQCEYAPPPVKIFVTSPGFGGVLTGETQASITWDTQSGSASLVDIWFSVNDNHFESMVAEDVPNTGVYVWNVPNAATTAGKLLIFPSSGTTDGFGFSAPFTIEGHKVRYVSSAGSNTPPYETPATAAHTISAAVLACTGYDSVMVAAGNYFETVTVSHTVRIFGGWDASFSTCDPEAHQTRLQGTSSAMKFLQGAGTFGGVDGIIFHDSFGGYYTDPEFGQHGGAIFCLESSPTISRCAFENNRASNSYGFGLGGAILAIGGAPTLQACRFSGNRATKGGAVALYGPAGADLQENLFLANTCSDSSSGYLGAALYISNGEASLSGDVFRVNGGTDKGGAICLESAVVTAQNLELTGNRSLNLGGAVYAGQSEFTLMGGQIAENRAVANGGGICGDSGGLVLQNVRLADNLAGTMGGAVMFMSATGGRVENCLVQGNQATVSTGGLFLAATGPYQVRNNIVASNSGIGLTVIGTSLTADYNDVWDNAGGDYGGGVPGPHDVSADPLFVDPAGGDYGLGLHTPCLDRGDPEPACQDPDGSPADIGLLGGPGAAMVAPAAVAGAQIEEIGGGVYRLTWTANSEPDMDQYVIYCDTADVFVPGPIKAIATVAHPSTEWEDSPAQACYYYIVPVDDEGHVGGYSQRLEAGGLSAVADGVVPRTLAIAAVVPNPFNPRTTIWYDVPRMGAIHLCVYDLRGRRVRELLAGQASVGRFSVVWDGRDDRGLEAAAGVYFVRLSGQGRSVTTKALLAK